MSENYTMVSVPKRHRTPDVRKGRSPMLCFSVGRTLRPAPVMKGRE